MPISRIGALVVGLIAAQASATSSPPAPNCRQTSCSCPPDCRFAPAEDVVATRQQFACTDPTKEITTLELLRSDDELRKRGYEPVRRYPGGIVVVRRTEEGARPPFDIESLGATIRAEGGTFEPDSFYRPHSQTPAPMPTDPEFDQQWPLHGAVEGSSCEPAHFSNDEHHQVEFCAPRCAADAAISPLVPWNSVRAHPPAAPTVLGVIDGLPFRNTDIDDDIWTNANPTGPPNEDEFPDDVHGYNAESGFGLVDKDFDRPTGYNVRLHGTSVTSILGAESWNGIGVMGIAQKPNVVLCSVGDRVSQYAACLYYFSALREQGVPLVAINISGGGTRCSCCIDKLLRRLREQGVLIVASAGNDGCSNGPLRSSDIRCNEFDTNPDRTCGRCPTYPASQRVSNVISVGAATCSGAPLSCSNYGERSVHLWAPGYDVRTAAEPAFGWTSAAAPHVTGAIGLLKETEAGSRLDWRGLRNRILAGGRPSATLATDAQCMVRERGQQTITKRNLLMWDELRGGKALGAVSCAGQRVRRRLLPLEKEVDVSLEERKPLTLSALSIRCESSDLTVPVSVEKSVRGKWKPFSKTALKDDGSKPDECAGDGEHGLDWTPPATGDYRLRFWKGTEPAEDLVVHVKP